jgi:hypothetical protein
LGLYPTEAAGMPKRKLNPAFKRLLIREFPAMELDEVVKLLDMGLLRLKKVRCAAMSRNNVFRVVYIQFHSLGCAWLVPTAAVLFFNW